MNFNMLKNSIQVLVCVTGVISPHNSSLQTKTLVNCIYSFPTYTSRENPKILMNCRHFLIVEATYSVWEMKWRFMDKLDGDKKNVMHDGMTLSETPEISDKVTVKAIKMKISHLISTLKADLCCFAPRLHSINENAETFFLTPEKAEGQWRVPGRLGQCHQPRLGFSSTCYI